MVKDAINTSDKKRNALTEIDSNAETSLSDEKWSDGESYDSGDTENIPHHSTTKKKRSEFNMCCCSLFFIFQISPTSSFIGKKQRKAASARVSESPTVELPPIIELPATALVSSGELVILKLQFDSQAMTESWENMKDLKVDGKNLFSYFGRSNGKHISTMCDATETLRQSGGVIGFFIECCASHIQKGSFHAHAVKTLIEAYNFNGEIGGHFDKFIRDFRAILTIGQNPKDGKGKVMTFKVRFHLIVIA
jgi:hypothetical protein